MIEFILTTIVFVLEALLVVGGILLLGFGAIIGWIIYRPNHE